MFVLAQHHVVDAHNLHSGHVMLRVFSTLSNRSIYCGAFAASKREGVVVVFWPGTLIITNRTHCIVIDIEAWFRVRGVRCSLHEAYVIILS